MRSGRARALLPSSKADDVVTATRDPVEMQRKDTRRFCLVCVHIGTVRWRMHVGALDVHAPSNTLEAKKGKPQQRKETSRTPRTSTRERARVRGEGGGSVPARLYAEIMESVGDGEDSEEARESDDALYMERERGTIRAAVVSEKENV